MAGQPLPPGSGERPRAWDVARTAYQVIRANPTGRIALKVGIALLGGAIVAVGIVLIPLPGPGWLIVLVGLSVWAIEFIWARHVLHFTRRQLFRWTHWIAARGWPVRLLVGAAGLVFVTFVVWASVRLSLGIDLWARLRTYLAAH